MHLAHDDPSVTSLSDGEATYVGWEGHFDVPEDLARRMAPFPGWRIDPGPVPTMTPKRDVPRPPRPKATRARRSSPKD